MIIGEWKQNENSIYICGGRLFSTVFCKTSFGPCSVLFSQLFDTYEEKERIRLMIDDETFEQRKYQADIAYERRMLNEEIKRQKIAFLHRVARECEPWYIDAFGNKTNDGVFVVNENKMYVASGHGSGECWYYDELAKKYNFKVAINSKPYRYLKEEIRKKYPYESLGRIW